MGVQKKLRSRMTHWHRRLFSRLGTGIRRKIPQLVGPKWAVRLRCLARGNPMPRWGNLRRTTPFSDEFGLERGTPLDRYYIDSFFEAHGELITGDVLEIESANYAGRFGRRVNRLDTVDIDPWHRPTYLCDLARAEEVIPSDAYDCFLLPQTLQHIRHLDAGLKNILRVVKPGGTVLATASSLNPLTPVKLPDYWRFTQAGWHEKLQSAWPGAEIEIEGHGNSLAAVAAMLGLAWEELDRAELDVHDRRFPVIVTIRARKPEAGSDRSES